MSIAGRLWPYLRGAVAAGTILSASERATLADAIDGNWCHPDGRRLSIHGSEMVTPGGNRIFGEYSRHYFSYRVPATEPAAGLTVYLVLRGEYVMHLRVGSAAADTVPEVWNRCPPDVSSLTSSPGGS